MGTQSKNRLHPQANNTATIGKRIKAASVGGSESIGRKLIINDICFLFEVTQVLVVIRQLSFYYVFITALGLAFSRPDVCPEED